MITSAPPLGATVGQPYAYNLQGYDPDGDPIYWNLTLGPAGMSLDPTLGRLRWTPLPTQDGPQNVTVRLVDNYGASATQSFTITVVGENLPPLITSEPPTQAQVGKLYSYAVQAGDADGDTLRYSVIGGFMQAQISASGLITWTPTSTGPFNFTLTVDDRPVGDTQDIATTQNWVVTVSSAVGRERRGRKFLSANSTQKRLPSPFFPWPEH